MDEGICPFANSCALGRKFQSPTGKSTNALIMNSSSKQKARKPRKIRLDLENLRYFCTSLEYNRYETQIANIQCVSEQNFVTNFDRVGVENNGKAPKP